MQMASSLVLLSQNSGLKVSLLQFLQMSLARALASNGIDLRAYCSQSLLMALASFLHICTDQTGRTNWVALLNPKFPARSRFRY